MDELNTLLEHIVLLNHAERRTLMLLQIVIDQLPDVVISKDDIKKADDEATDYIKNKFPKVEILERK